MIPANGEWEAIFTEGDGHRTTKKILAWNDEGEALVPDSSGVLVVARKIASFSHIDEVDILPPAAAVPGGGWMVEYEEEDGSTSYTPVVAWSIDPMGPAVPLTTYRSMSCGDTDALVEDGSGSFLRLIPPGEVEEDDD